MPGQFRDHVSFSNQDRLRTTRSHACSTAAVDHVLKANFLAKWQCQRLYADNHGVMMELPVLSTGARKRGYRIFDVEFQLHTAALSGELLSCSLAFFQSFLFINWPVIEREKSYTTPFQVNAWVEARSKNNTIQSNELQIMGAGKQSHTPWLASKQSTQLGIW